MDSTRFDALARSLSGASSRRGIFASVLGLGIGLLSRHRADAACPAEQVLAPGSQCVCHATG